MKERVNVPDIRGYLTVEQAAKRLGLAVRTVQDHIANGRIKAERGAHAYLIPEEEVEKFQRIPAGRERKVVPRWRISLGTNEHFMTRVILRIRAGQEAALEAKLEPIRKSGEHLFPGTVARYFARSASDPTQLEIVLIWRGSIMPDHKTREQEIEGFRQALADVVDWEGARVEESVVLMHT